MQLLNIVSWLLLLAAPGATHPCCTCLPKEIQPTYVVSYQDDNPSKKGKHPVTVAEKLASLKAHCKKGKLIDGTGKEIRFFHLTGCWGNPPEDYQEILDEQSRKLAQLKKRYTVIELTCNPSGMLIS